MVKKIFEQLYSNLQLPVVVCSDDPDMNVVYANTSALILVNPSILTDHLDGMRHHLSLRQVLPFHLDGVQQSIYQSLKSAGALDGYRTAFIDSDGKPAYVQINANIVEQDGEKYFILYLQGIQQSDLSTLEDRQSILFSILNTSYHATDIDAAIESIISIVGHFINVSRVYIFEDLFNNYTRNTYEWCAPGIEAAIQDLQNLCKDDYNYDAIVGSSSVFVTDDVRKLPLADREILEMQGIMSLAILPFFHLGEPLGYIGFDDCNQYRVWSIQELQFLQNIASIVSSLINRRNTETQLNRSHEILQTITDNTNSVIYVSDLQSYELKFVNRMLANQLGVAPEELIGSICWKVLQEGMSAPCPFCPVPHLLDDAGNPQSEPYEWEHYNKRADIWVWAKDAIIPWIDGQPVHIETAVDITFRKSYEEQLRHFASTDSLTGIFNREWAYHLLQEAHSDTRISGEGYSLCFIDLDGLKKVNDAFGHQSGDTMILDILQVIKNNIRKDDLLCRWGGDEFILLLKCGGDKAAKVVKTIQAELVEVTRTRGYAYPLSFSYGIADFPGVDTLDTLVTKADQTMYADKMRKRR